MAFDEGLAERLRECFRDHSGVTERKMFGGLAFMWRGYMCVGVLGESLMARVGPEQYANALMRPHVRKMDFTGKPMKGYVYVAPSGFESDEDLARWVGQCMRFVESLPPR